MRKLIVPLVVAGMFAFTASQAMAAYSMGSGFNETHKVNDGSVLNGTGAVIDNGAAGQGNHYKKTDIVEVGRDGFQLSSAILKDLALEANLTVGDAAYGYYTGANPFYGDNPIGLPPGVGSGIANANQYVNAANSMNVLTAPAYTSPCPEFVDADGSQKTGGGCEANTDATDPQTDVPIAVDDGTVLDDVYQRLGANETTGAGFNNLTNTGKIHYRTFDQWLDQLFYKGKRIGTISVDNVDITATLDANGDGKIDTAQGGSHFNIDDTLDQDIADWENVNDGVENEIMGIYGKLTLIFQIAAPHSSSAGCASGGNGGFQVTDGNPDTDPCAAQTAMTGSAYAEAAEGAGDLLSTFMLDQWVVSDVWDWIPARNADGSSSSYDLDKWAGNGLQQGYQSWFRDGSSLDIAYGYDYVGGHGAITKTFDPGSNHTQPDP